MDAMRTGYPFLIDRESATSDREQLARLGFTEAQIARMFELRTIYPMVELVDTREELLRLIFLKWLHAKWVKTSVGGQPGV